MPPPNITGVLHMGHVLNMTLQDVLIRHARNSGYESFWLPGLDHAAIATEAKVIDSLKKQGIKKTSLTREQFLDHCWQWKEQYGGTIIKQLKALNICCDWDKMHFTLDEEATTAVLDTFIKLYNEGLLYRSEKMINWDCKARTALSDEEVIFKEADNILYYIKYKLVDSDVFLTIATSRPETLFGDVAIGVNPTDERYNSLIGKNVIVPFIERHIPIIGDEYVDKSFGTGGLKITPAHDFNDYALGQKHGLAVVNIMDERGYLNDRCGAFAGQERFVARKNITEALKDQGLLVKEEHYTTRLGYSERSGVVVEPRLSQQWFIKMKALATTALRAVMEGEITFHPERFVNIYRSWMENINDWCISRQLWWGHRIPVYYYKDSMCAAHDINEALKIFQEHDKTAVVEDLRQDSDVLDTWFSAALWPEITTHGTAVTLPTDDLVTGPDIIFFWVARMIMMTLYTHGKLPFRHVYFTGIIRDAQGRKMSKSLGNSPDPLQLIERYGSDGVRFGILLSTQAGNDLRFDEKLCKTGRNFVTKIKNAHRLLTIWRENEDDSIIITEDEKNAMSSFEAKRNTAKDEIQKKFEEYRINEAAMILYKLMWDDFCSTYLEQMKKPFGEKMSTTVVDRSFSFFNDMMKDLNPFIPEITTQLLNSD